MLLKQGTRLLFNGDSITDVGRARPIGTAPASLGAGYPNLINAMLTAYQPQQKIYVMNTAVSGDTIRMMASRWEEDTLAHKPDWVSVMIGINDVWRHFDHPLRPEMHVGQTEYTDIYRRLIETTLPKVQGMVLMTPYYVDFSKTDPMTQMVHTYATVVRDLAKEYGLVLCDTQQAMDDVQRSVHHMGFSSDRVHPNEQNLTGHFVLARAFLDAIQAWPL